MELQGKSPGKLRARCSPGRGPRSPLPPHTPLLTLDSGLWVPSPFFPPQPLPPPRDLEPQPPPASLQPNQPLETQPLTMGHYICAFQVVSGSEWKESVEVDSLCASAGRGSCWLQQEAGGCVAPCPSPFPAVSPYNFSRWYLDYPAEGWEPKNYNSRGALRMQPVSGWGDWPF